MHSGIIYYLRKERTLVGKWTHQDIGGLLADEIVRDVAPGATEGLWPVDINAPNGDLMFTGQLSSRKLGESLLLEWSGILVEQQTPARFIGIGICLNDDLIVASFEQVDLARQVLAFKWQAGIEEMFARLPGPKGERFATAFEHYSLKTLIYAPVGSDPQQPHTQDEIYIVMSGRGDFVRGDEKVPFRTGDLLFVPAGLEHRFENFSADLKLWVAFYGPVGGEEKL
jgi:mannose-6-phosphate isomerase-like protein (cupin superfamily)